MISKRFFVFVSLFSICCCLAFSSKKVIQIDISKLLNARPVTTFTEGKLITWTKGIDGNGSADGYLTTSAAEFNGEKGANALSDNPIFLATKQHPEIKLYYNNSDSVSKQAMYISGEGEFTIKIPKQYYSEIYLGLSSAEGSSDLRCHLRYANSEEIKNYTLTDYYNNVATTDTVFSCVVTDLAKWGSKNNMTEKDHHNIHLLKIKCNPLKKLEKITVKKSKKGYLLLWSATGVTR